MYAQKNCVLNASEHVYNLVCDLKINTHGNMPKKVPTYQSRRIHTPRPAYDQEPCGAWARMQARGAEYLCCQQAPRGRGDESQAMYCLQLIGACEGSRSRVYKPVRRSLAWRGGTKLPPPNGYALRCALRGSALGPIRAGWPRAALLRSLIRFKFSLFLFLFIFVIFKIKSLFFYIISNSVY